MVAEMRRKSGEVESKEYQDSAQYKILTSI
jgi:hypothetical protein